MSVTNKCNYGSFDITKMIFSFMVVGLHIMPLNYIGEEIQFWCWDIISRICVPCFFMISSFLYFSNKGDEALSKRNVFLYIERILKLYLTWFVFNLPWILCNRVFQNGVEMINIIKFILNIFLSSTFLGSWYLSSSVFSVIFIYFLSKRLGNKGLLSISLLLYIFCTLSSAYCNFFPTNSLLFKILHIYPWYNSIFAGCFFFTLGKIFSDNKNLLCKLQIKLIIFILMVSLIFAYTEIYYIKMNVNLESTHYFFSLIPLSITVFCLIFKCELRTKDVRNLRNISTIVYCSHGSIWSLVVYIGMIFNKTLSSVMIYIITICLCSLLSLYIIKISNNKEVFKLLY